VEQYDEGRMPGAKGRNSSTWTVLPELWNVETTLRNRAKPPQSGGADTVSNKTQIPAHVNIGRTEWRILTEPRKSRDPLCGAGSQPAGSLPRSLSSWPCGPPNVMKNQTQGGQFCPQPAFSQALAARKRGLRQDCGHDWPPQSWFSTVPHILSPREKRLNG